MMRRVEPRLIINGVAQTAQVTQVKPVVYNEHQLDADIVETKKSKGIFFTMSCWYYKVINQIMKVLNTKIW